MTLQTIAAWRKIVDTLSSSLKKCYGNELSIDTDITFPPNRKEDSFPHNRKEDSFPHNRKEDSFYCVLKSVGTAEPEFPEVVTCEEEVFQFYYDKENGVNLIYSAYCDEEKKYNCVLK